jgi:hypothetical protein
MKFLNSCEFLAVRGRMTNRKHVRLPWPGTNKKNVDKWDVQHCIERLGSFFKQPDALPGQAPSKAPQTKKTKKTKQKTKKHY